MIRDIQTQDALHKEIKDVSNPVFLYFFAPWCSICHAYSFKIEQFSQKHLDVKVIKIDVSVAQEISNYYNILNVPSIIVLKGGDVYHRFSHIQPMRELENILLH